MRARGRIKTSQKKIRHNNLIMVSTRRSPQKKTCPTGVPTLSGQAHVRAERAEQQAEQRSAAEIRDNQMVSLAPTYRSDPPPSPEPESRMRRESEVAPHQTAIPISRSDTHVTFPDKWYTRFNGPWAGPACTFAILRARAATGPIIPPNALLTATARRAT